jgi:hypothetical protein
MAMNAEDFPSFNTEILSTMKFIAENFDTIKSMPKQSDIIKIKSTKKRAAKDESTKNQKNQNRRPFMSSQIPILSTYYFLATVADSLL